MKKQEILKYINASDINLTLFDCVASTNDVLKQEALNGAKEGTVIAALKQTGGKGRKGRVFISNNGGIYLSILVRPKTFNFDTTLITCATAVAVSKAIEEISGKATQIKWVNDILIDTKKVCGILCESAICGENAFTVVGIGINLFADKNALDSQIKNIATTVFDNEDANLNNRLVAKVINNFFGVYNTIEDKQFLSDYRKRSIALGKEVLVGDKIAKAIDIDDNCRLKVEYSDGSWEFLSSGEISIKLKEL